MNKAVITIIAIVLVGIAGYLLFSSTSLSTSQDSTAQSVSQNNLASTEEKIKTFNVDSSHLRFFIDGKENPDIIVKEGDTVKIEFKSSEGFHDFVVDEFNAATEKVREGETTSVEFIADKKGTFEYYCSVGQHRANGMKGKLIVE